MADRGELVSFDVMSLKTMNPDIEAFNEGQATVEERQICETLATTIGKLLPEAEKQDLASPSSLVLRWKPNRRL